MPQNTVTLSINGQVVNVRWEENETAAELLSYAEKEKIEVQTERYGGFEQVGGLPRAFPRNDSQITTKPGDIVLYSGDQIVVFFGTNSWSYTKLGHIEGLSEDELKDLLGGNSAFLEIYGETAG